jgi:hypothetical protein
VRLHATFGKEAQSLPGIRVLLHAEDLNVHARRLGIIEWRGCAPRLDLAPES